MIYKAINDGMDILHNSKLLDTCAEDKFFEDIVFENFWIIVQNIQIMSNAKFNSKAQSLKFQ